MVVLVREVRQVSLRCADSPGGGQRFVQTHVRPVRGLPERIHDEDLDAGSLLVRTKILPDSLDEGDHTFRLIATNTGGTSTPITQGIGTIDDHGGGELFPDLPPNNDGTPAKDTSTVKDDDRPLSVDNVRVNEGSPYVVFTVTGAANQLARLSLVDGTALVDANGVPQTDGSEDYGPGLEYWDPTAGTSGQWKPYTGDSTVSVPAGGNTLLVRTSIIADRTNEGDQTFRLIATTTGGVSSPANEGIGTIENPFVAQRG